MITLRDNITGECVTVEKDAAAETLAPWFSGAPEGTRQEVRDMIEALQDALNQGKSSSGFAAYLNISVEFSVTVKP